jgi:predicted metal-binding protein
MSATVETTEVLKSKHKSKGQLLLCKGCCCGKTERGLPDVPVDRIKAAWKADKLNKVIQLTISGCLGPCDLPNVAVLLTPEGATWLGNLAGDAHYDTLIEWARASALAGSPLTLPEGLEAYRFERFRAAEPAQED